MQSCYTSDYRESYWCKVVIPATVGNLIGAKVVIPATIGNLIGAKLFIPATIGNLIGAKLLYLPL